MELDARLVARSSHLLACRKLGTVRSLADRGTKMQLQQRKYHSSDGWSQPLPTALDSANTLVLAFGAPRYGADRRPFDDLAAAFPHSVRTGCSTAGEIGGAEVDDDSVSVLIGRFEHSHLVSAATDIGGPDDSGPAGERLASQLPSAGLRAVFVLSDGLSVNGTLLVAGLTRSLPAGVPVTGGLAGDGSRFASTWVHANGASRPKQICAVGFYGDRLRIGHGCDGGWSDFGPTRLITRSVGNVMYELDGRPALDLYKEYLGKLATGLPGTALLFPLSVRRPGDACTPLVRTVLGVDELARTMTFAGDVPQGHEARLMRTTDDGLIASAATAIAAASAHLSSAQPRLVIAVSCVGRRLVLGERTEEEVEAVAEGAPSGSVHIGFYSYGEISPHAQGGACGLHNQTMTVTVLTEE